MDVKGETDVMWTRVDRSETLVERTLMEVSGTMLTVDLALARGLAVNTAGGTHYAHHD